MQSKIKNFFFLNSELNVKLLDFGDNDVLQYIHYLVTNKSPLEGGYDNGEGYAYVGNRGHVGNLHIFLPLHFSINLKLL